MLPLYSGVGKISNRPEMARILGAGGPIWTTTSWGAKIQCYRDDYVGRAVFFFGDLDPKLSWVMKKVLKPGDQFIDVGANIGLLTLLGSKLVGPSGKVLAIEPQPRAYSCLQNALVSNEVSNVSLGLYGVGSEPGDLRLHVPSGNMGGASFRHVPSNEADVVDVKVTTLSEAAKDSGCERARLVKLDVEGFEAEVIEGAKEVWAKTPPEVVIFEFREEGLVSETHLGDLMRELGYRFYRLPRKYFRPCLVKDGDKGQPFSHDVIAIHQEVEYDPLSFFNGH